MRSIAAVLCMLLLAGCSTLTDTKSNTGLGTSPFRQAGKFLYSDANAMNDAINDNDSRLDTLEAQMENGRCISLADLSDGDSVYCTCVDDFIAGENITLGALPDPVYMKPSVAGGRIFLASSDSADTDKDTYPVLGDAITSATTGNAITVDFGRFVKITREDSYSSWTADQDEGKVGYLSSTPGAVTLTQPTTLYDDITRVLIVLHVDGASDGIDGDIFLRLRQETSVRIENVE